MNKFKRSRSWFSAIVLLAGVITILSFVASGHAQDIAGSTSQSLTVASDSLAGDIGAPAASQALPAVTDFIITETKSHPWVGTIIFIMGALRALFKPIMSVVEQYVKARCTPAQYGELLHFESGTVYKWLSWILDFGGSIKLPTVGAAANVAGQPKVNGNGG